MTPRDYWASGAGLGNITPAGIEWPEGEFFQAILKDIVGRSRSVIEVGCGPGRLAQMFAPGLYRGVDICPAAIDLAREATPSHQFSLIDDAEPFPEADVTLFHTVLLHIPDGKLASMIARIRSPRVIVGEILGRRWRRPGNPPVFNRERADYEAAFAPARRLARVTAIPYPRYPNTDLSLMEFVPA